MILFFHYQRQIQVCNICRTLKVGNENERIPSDEKKLKLSSNEKEGQAEDINLCTQQGFILIWSEWTNGFHDDSF